MTCQSEGVASLGKCGFLDIFCGRSEARPTPAWKSECNLDLLALEATWHYVSLQRLVFIARPKPKLQTKGHHFMLLGHFPGSNLKANPPGKHVVFMVRPRVPAEQPFGHCGRSKGDWKASKSQRDCGRSRLSNQKQLPSPESAPTYERLWSNRSRLYRLPIAPESKGLGKCDCKDSCDESCLNALMLMECGPSNCRFASCGNRQFAHAAAGGLENLTEVFWTGSRKGFGLRARKHLIKNQLVAEYLGEISVISSIQNWRYIMSLPQGFAIDASMAGGPARFINHSCEPNCNAQRWLVEGWGFKKTKIGLLVR